MLKETQLDLRLLRPNSDSSYSLGPSAPSNTVLPRALTGPEFQSATFFTCSVFKFLLARLRRIVTCIGPFQNNQSNLDLYLVRRYLGRYKICHFPIVVSYLCIGQNQKNQPNLVLYLVRRSKIFVSVTTLLLACLFSNIDAIFRFPSLMSRPA